MIEQVLQDFEMHNGIGEGQLEMNLREIGDSYDIQKKFCKGDWEWWCSTKTIII